ncbi:MAG: carbohydrate ABC transporter permease [Chloroflexi bacterium]|nr:MAG: carbohydrate ABC transporter permease [Chloroflexota bacterium]
MTTSINSSTGWQSSKRLNKIFKNIWVYCGLIFFIVTMLFPFYWMLITSITPDNIIYDINRNSLLVSEPTIEHYIKLLQDSPFLLWLKNSLLVAIVSTSISLVVGTMAAYSLARLRFRGGQTMGMLIFVTYLVPTTLLFLPLAYVVRNLGMFDKPIALMVTYPTFLIPFCTWLLMGYFKGIPKELEECAMVDGCTRFGAFFKIVLPISLPGLVSAGLFAFTLSWNEFIYALTLAQSNSVKTLPTGVVSQLVLGDVYFWGQLMAAALLGSVPIAILYSFFLEYYVKGMTAGAVKG